MQEIPACNLFTEVDMGVIEVLYAVDPASSLKEGKTVIVLLGPEEDEGRTVVDMNDEILHQRLLRLKILDAVCLKPKRYSNALVVKSKTNFSVETVKSLAQLFSHVFQCWVVLVPDLTPEMVSAISQEPNVAKLCPRRKRWR